MFDPEPVLGECAPWAADAAADTVAEAITDAIRRAQATSGGAGGVGGAAAADVTAAADAALPGDGADYGLLVDAMRCRPTDWLAERRAVLVRAQRRLHLEALAVTRVLDERGAVDDTLARADGVSVRAVRETVATARALEDLPEIAAAAAAGALSEAQLAQVVRVADPTDPGADARWAAEAPSWSPADLAHQARIRTTPTAEEGRARRAARSLGFWWRQDSGMLDGRFSLPDVDGALVASVLDEMIDRMRPAKGQPWETRARRGADALVELARNYADVNAVSRPTPHIVVQVPLEGPAMLAGVPLPDGLVESLRASAGVEAVAVDRTGTPVATARTTRTLSPKRLRAVRLRDGRCRVPGCDRRTGLEAHHLWPASWGGSDEIHNLAMVCTGGSTDHHAQLVPQGPWLLAGNPNHPNGLALVHRREVAELTARAARSKPGESRDPPGGPAP
jgi:hypothetical protein